MTEAQENYEYHWKDGERKLKIVVKANGLHDIQEWNKDKLAWEDISEYKDRNTTPVNEVSGCHCTCKAIWLVRDGFAQFIEATKAKVELFEEFTHHEHMFGSLRPTWEKLKQSMTLDLRYPDREGESK